MSRDYNPLHADPRIGEKLGMKGAILHGLCSVSLQSHRSKVQYIQLDPTCCAQYGIASAAVLKQFGHNDPSNFKSIYGRFASPVYPGETLETSMWKEVESGGYITIAFVTKVKERDTVVISNGTVVVIQRGKL